MRRKLQTNRAHTHREQKTKAKVVHFIEKDNRRNRNDTVGLGLGEGEGERETKHYFAKKITRKVP